MITILLEKIKALLLELKTNIENISFDNDYSLNERYCGLWVDGSKMYQRSFYVDELPDAGGYTIEIATLDDDIDKVVYMDGIAISKSTEGIYSRPLPFSASSADAIRIDVTNNVLRLITYTRWPNYMGYITIRYTKKQEE